MAPVVEFPAALPIIAPASAPAPEPITVPFAVLLILSQPAEIKAMIKINVDISRVMIVLIYN